MNPARGVSATQSGALILLKESAHELVVVKPAGLASELPGEDATSVKALLARRVPGRTPKLPHRLDRVTRGILLMCLSKESIAFHNAQIKARRWEKYYLARVAANDGVSPVELLGKHKAFLVEEAGRARIVRAGGKPAWLEILAVAPAPAVAEAPRWHLLIRLLTGRFHQIRVMCAALGLPLAGDPLYDEGARDAREFYLEHIMLKYTDFDTQAPSTLFLRQCEGRGEVAASLMSRLEALAERDEPSAG